MKSRPGVVRWNQHILPLGNPFNTANAIGIPGININDKSGGLPALTVSGFQVLGDNSTYPEQSQTTIVPVRRHRDQDPRIAHDQVRRPLRAPSVQWLLCLSGPAVPYDFNGQFTRQTGTSGSADGAGRFRSRRSPTASRAMCCRGTFGMRIGSLGAFADDAWRVTNRFTLNYRLALRALRAARTKSTTTGPTSTWSPASCCWPAAMGTAAACATSIPAILDRAWASHTPSQATARRYCARDSASLMWRPARAAASFIRTCRSSSRR